MTHDTGQYELLSGTHRTRDGTVHDPGAVIELPDSVYESLSYKFAPVDDEPTADDTATATATEPEPGVAGLIPEDWDALRAMASAWDGDEISGHASRDEIEAFLATLTETQVRDLRFDAGLDAAESA